MNHFPKDTSYFHDTYGLTLPHSEVVEVAEKKIIPCGRALDLGCGMGRNTLYLNQHGFSVTAVDQSEGNLATLTDIIQKEGLSNINYYRYDINQAKIEETFDFIFSTVVFMFLQPETISQVIANMQEKTALGGYNLIISAMDTEEYPCRQGFSFAFKTGELEHYYKDWMLLKYNEEVGELHRLDENGQRIKLQFATLLARK